MKKSKKLLRKLLREYAIEIEKQPYTNEKSNTLELIDYFLERLSNAK